MNMTVVSKDGSEHSAGTLTVAISKAGMRGEIDMPLGPGGAGKSTVLCKTDSPNINYLISDADRTYSEFDLSQPTLAEGPKPAQWTVEKLGREKVLGYKTRHVLAKPKAGKGQSMELWVATDLLNSATCRKLQAFSGGSLGGEGGMNQALKAAGAEGMPLKAVVTTAEGGKVRLEVVKAEKKALPASTFEVPAGYNKSVGGRTW